MFQVDGGGGTGPLARAQAAEAAKRAAEEAAKRAAEEAAKRAAEEAARRAAEEAARRAAEEAAARQAQEAAARKAAESTKAAGTERYAAYAAPDEPPTPPAPVEPKAPEAPQGLLAKMMSAFSLGEKPPTAPVAPPLVGPVAPSETAAVTPALPTEIQAKVVQAQEQAPAKEADKKERLAKPSDAEMADNAKEPVRPEHEEVFNTLSPEQQQAFRELSTKGRANFDQVFHAVGGMWAEPTQYSQEASDGLRKLLQEHRLEVKDTEGGTLIGTLAKRSEDAPRPEVAETNSTIGLLQSAIKQVANPDRVFQGENTNTCASTALQGIMANEDPAEFLRVATGLVFDGHVKLQGGADLKLDASKVGDAGDGNRSALSDAVQTSFDTFAKQFPPQSDADFGGGRVGGGGRYGGGRVGSYERFGGGRVGLGERFGGGRVGSGERFGEGTAIGAQVGGAHGGQVDGGGLTQNQIEKLYENVAGRLAINVTVEDANRFSTLDGVAAALKGGQKVPVGVQGVDEQGQATHHMISVLGIHKDAEDPGKDKVVFTDPGTGKPATLTVDQFAKLMEAVILPAQYADHMRWNVQPNDSDFGGGRVGGGGRMG